MRLRKTTEYKAVYKENMNRIGRVYLPIPLINRLIIGDEIIVQLAPDKTCFPPGGYATQFVFKKETKTKIQFIEGIEEKGELGCIYISKNILEHMGIRDEIAVRVVLPEESGGVAVAQ